MSRNPVKAQLEAYNAKDIDAFMACWAPDAEIYAHPDTLLAKGHVGIRDRHLLRFQEPDLHARLVSRLILGETVVDTEIVTRNFPDGLGEIDVVGIYDVADGLIRKAWFIMGVPRF
ncbi:nuclear transport factor 2 family protein [Asticcacaulis sp. 201]|uniref:nuclear transport factor 2 family protein n=1 Tax=Asticcacaulis sp. 201 TaxID=3028787 RepID=UPI002916A291|nr:nuclear transport factor 2 family protein [Asticcacaulis sp. 201]MDV6331780.1 nuclear transport factor 2 family protein [Asticcacaulis sp. 201]